MHIVRGTKIIEEILKEGNRQGGGRGGGGGCHPLRNHFVMYKKTERKNGPHEIEKTARTIMKKVKLKKKLKKKKQLTY